VLIIKEGPTISIEVTLNGRARCPVIVWRRASEETLALDTLNVVAADARAKLVATLSEDLRAEAAALLEQVGIEVARREADQFLNQLSPDGAEPHQGTAITLSDPAPWPVAVQADALLGDLTGMFTRFVALPEGAADVLALWTLFTHAHDAFAISPLLALVSPEKQCGKTRTLTLLGAVTRRSLLASNISGAALFRTVEKFSPTLLVDEVDTFLDARDELRGILNSGHTRAAAFVVRTVGDDFEPRLFSTWCPKALARIGELPDTLTDRSLVVRLRRCAPNETVADLRSDRLEGFEPLRRQARRWAEDTREILSRADPAMPAELSNRAADNARPLLAIADVAGGEWPARIRRAVVLLAGGAAMSEEAPAVLLLADVRAFLTEQQVDRVSSAELVNHLTAREDRPWPEWRHGKPLTPRQLARLVGRFGVVPRVIRLGSGTARGYLAEQFADAFARYCPPERNERNDSVPAQESPASTIRNAPEPVTDLKVTEKPRGATSVTDVTDTEGRGERSDEDPSPGDSWA
jgi:uncharacterized protein DUF3631